MDNEQVIQLNAGMVHNLNVLDESILSFDLLENVTMKNNALVVEPVYLPFAQLQNNTTFGEVDNYIYLFNTEAQEGFFALKIDKSVYWLVSPEENLFQLKKVTDLYEVEPTEGNSGKLYADADDDAILQSAFWNWQNSNVAIFTKPGLPLYKAEGQGSKLTISRIPDTFSEDGENLQWLSAKYILITKDRSFIANVMVNSVRWYTRIHWSNLNKPDDFSVGLNKQSDYVYVGNNAEEITGLGYSHDTVYVFCKNIIYTLDYENSENLFRLNALNFTIGNVYHYAVINVNDVLYFCGRDNFYAIENNTITPIGDEIWPWFTTHIKDLITHNLPAQYEIKQKTITWLFTDKESSVTYGIKYNVDNKTWSVKEMQSNEYI